MGTSEQDRSEPLSVRLTALEELLTHVERTVEQLDEVVRQMQARLDGMETGHKRLSRQLGMLSERLDHDRSAGPRPPS